MMKTVLSLLMALTLAAATAHAEQKPLETFTAAAAGDAVIARYDYIDARAAAKNEAVRRALRMVAEQLVPPDQIAASGPKIESALLTRAWDFVQKYKFLEEAISPDNTVYHVAIEVTFFADNVRGALEGSGAAVAKRKRAVIVISENAVEGVSGGSFLLAGSVTEDKLRQAALTAGFKGTDRAELRALKNDAQVAKAVEGDTEAIRWLAQTMQADIVITGTARAAAQGDSVAGTTVITIYGPDGARLWDKEIGETVPGSGGLERFKAVRLCAEKAAIVVSEFLAAKK